MEPAAGRKKKMTDLSDEEKTKLTASLIQHGIDLSTIGTLKENGEYILFAPYSFLLTLYHETPDSFFGGGVWNVSLASGGEELLGSENVAHAREKIDNQYSDTTTLQRVKLSVEFLQKEMVE